MDRSPKQQALIRFAAIAVIGGFLGVCYIGLSLSFGDEWVAKNRFQILTHGIYIWIILFLAREIFLFEKTQYISPPKVVQTSSDGLLITKNQSWLGNGVMVSVFVVDKGIERLKGMGEVTNVQLDGLVQIQITKLAKDVEMKEISDAETKSILIKPGVINYA